MAAKKKPAKRKIKIDKKDAAKRIKKILAILKREFPDARTELNYKGAFQLMVATILSAQCTDVRVNIVTKDLFKKYKSPKDFAQANVKEIEADIKSTGFYRNKAKNIKAASQALIEKFDGKIPKTREELVTLAGVGRKTANVILANAFGIPAISCDTHVIRLSRRIGLSANSDPVKLEFDLAEIVEEKDWAVFSHTVILLGRYVCKARKPNCNNCPITVYCPAAHKPELW